MTSFEDLCEEVRSRYPQLDDNLLVALMVAMIEGKHIVIQTKRSSPVKSTLDFIARDLLGFRNRLMIQCSQDMQWNDLAGFIAGRRSTATGSEMKTGGETEDTRRVPDFLVLENLDRTSRVVQTMLLDMLFQRKFVFGQETYRLSDHFLLVILGRGHELLPHLRDYLLLEHVVESIPNDNINNNQEETIQNDSDVGKSSEKHPHSPSNHNVKINTATATSTPTSEFHHDNAYGSHDSLNVHDHATNELDQSPSLTKESNQQPFSINNDNNNDDDANTNDTNETRTDDLGSLEPFVNRAISKIPQIIIVADIKRYMQNIVIALRNHRLIRRGVSPRAVKDFDYLVRTLSVFHDYDFVTPSIVAVAARKLFPLRIQLCSPKDEPSLNYGGDIDIVTQWMTKWDEELVIEEVLSNVPAPL